MSDKEVLISVICPVYNAEAYVTAIVRSVLSQTFPSLELICVDDCSTDKSYEILTDLAKEDGRLSVYRAQENLGAGQARNLGMEKAKGQYITFVDADDTIELDLYEKAFSLTENGTVDEVVWGLTEEHYNGKNQHTRSLSILPEPVFCKTREEMTRTILHLERDTLFGYQWNSLYKTSLIREHHIRFSTALFYEDYFFNLDFIKCADTLRMLDFAGYHYYKRHNASVTNRFSKDYFSLSYQRVETMFSFCRERDGLTPEAYGILANKLLRYTLSALSRNNNPLSGMDKKARKQWFLQTASLPLYQEILPHAGKQNPVFTLLKTAIMKKRAYLPLTMGKLLFWLRK